MTFAIR